MILALDTGWTPRAIGALPARFRAACHWALYARALTGPEGIPSGDIPQGATPDVLRAAIRVREEVQAIRAVLYPEGD